MYLNVVVAVSRLSTPSLGITGRELVLVHAVRRVDFQLPLSGSPIHDLAEEALEALDLSTPSLGITNGRVARSGE